MDNSNVPIGSIQKILGHENRSTTEIYLHSFGMAERDAISVYELARQKSHTNNEKGAAITANPLIYWSRKADLNRRLADYESVYINYTTYHKA